MIFFKINNRNPFLYMVGLLILLTLPLSSMEVSVGGLRTSIPNILIYLFLIKILILLASEHSKIPDSFRKKHNLKYLGLMIILILVHALLLDYSEKSFSILVTIFGGMLSYMTGLFIGSDLKRTKDWENIAFISVVSTCVIGISHYLNVLPLFDFEKRGAVARAVAGFSFENRGSTGLINARGDYGLWCLLGLAVASRWFLLEGFFTKAVALAGLLVILIAMFVTQSRSTWVAATIFTLLMPFIISGVKSNKLKIRQSSLVIYFFSSLIAIVLIIGFSYSTLIGVFDSIVNVEVRSVEHREHGNELGFEAMLNYPLIGTGLGDNSVQNKHGYYIHNSFIYIASVYGVVVGGLLLFFFLNLVQNVFKYAIRSPRYKYRVYSAIWFACLLGMAVEMMLFNGVFSKYFWFIMGLIRGEATIIKTSRMSLIS